MLPTLEFSFGGGHEALNYALLHLIGLLRMLLAEQSLFLTGLRNRQSTTWLLSLVLVRGSRGSSRR